MGRMHIQETVGVEIAPESIVTDLSVEESKTDTLPKKIVTVVEAIHSGLTRNHTFYPGRNLESSVTSWTAPYNKPVIKNHNIHEEPLGRVLSASFKQSAIDPEKETIELELEITDPKTIEKVMDGRYQTLSIGGSTSSAVCSVCSKDLVKEGYCGHMKGRLYDGKQAFWTIGEMEFEEISWVNVPADRNARVVQKDAAAQQESVEGGVQMEEQTDILDQIDHLRESNREDETAVSEETETNQEETVVEEEAEETVSVEELQAQIETLQTENTALLAENTTFQESLTSLSAERDGLAAQVESLQADLDAAEQEAKGLMKQNVTVASYTHRALAEGVAALQVVLSKTETSYEETVRLLTKETSRSLKEQLTTLSKEKPQRIVETVESPGLVDTTEDDATSEIKEETKTVTIQDLAESMNQYFTKLK